MSDIHAALVEEAGAAPRFRSMPDPVAGPGQEIVDVLAVGIHQVTRGIASGRHYVRRQVPFVPGVDGVVRRADGSLAAVIGPETGTMAQRLAVDPSALIPLPDGDPALLAASLNPVISSWMAVRARVDVVGRAVLVLGATGTSGAAAVRVVRHLGATRVVAAGRDETRLAALGADADAVVPLGDPDRAAAALAAEAADVDVVLDYLWGPVTELALRAILGARADESQLLDWIEIGSVAGAEITLPAGALRSRALRLSGSGIGSTPAETFRREAPLAAAAILAGVTGVTPRRVPLTDVEEAWAHDDAPGERTVIML
jgi:NADPH2:quinone reductase